VCAVSETSVLAAPEPLDQLLRARVLARGRARDALRADSEPGRELRGDARVLAEDRVGRGQRALGARRQVFQVSDGCSDDEEAAGGRLSHGDGENNTGS